MKLISIVELIHMNKRVVQASSKTSNIFVLTLYLLRVTNIILRIVLLWAIEGYYKYCTHYVIE